MTGFDFQKNLEISLSSEKFIELYRQLREKHELLKSFITPKELIDFLHEFKQKHYQANDDILKILIREYQSRGQNQFIYYYLLKILTPGLNSIFYRFRKRIKGITTIDDFDLWSQIRCFFLEILDGFDTEIKYQRIAATIIGRVRDKLNRWCYLQSKNQEIGIDYIGELAKGDVKETAFEGDTIEDLKTKLEVLVRKRVIKENDLYVILATRIYGYSLEELAKKEGLKYGSMARRRERAEKRIRNYLETIAKEQGLDLKNISLNIIKS